ncbi:hypothetical protein SASC598P14_002540, partial [Snodgrassella alvi SCGC AB-598-P14]
MTLFNQSYQSYGTRRIRFDLQKENIWVSRRYIARVMKALLLVSKYTVKRYQSHTTEVNETAIENHLQRQFDVGDKKQIVVAALAYIQVKQR